MISEFPNWLEENYIEVVGVVFGILGVWLTTKQIIWCWPVALINVLLYIYIFFTAKLYADFGLQIFYFVMTIYGWYNWKFGGKEHSILKVSRAGKKRISIYILIGTLSFLTSGFLLEKYTDAAYPYWDSFVSVWGIIGTFMLARKQIENWIVWIIIDLNCMGIYFFKELYPTVALYFIFTILAFIGYYKWKKDLRPEIVSSKLR